MELRAAKIEGVKDDVVRIRALAIDGVSEVLETLTNWAESEPKNHTKIIHSMKIAALTKRGMPYKEKFFKPSDNYSNVYELVAYSLKARVMFFYLDDTVIVCTTSFWKSHSDKQDTAFKACEEARILCFENRQHIIIE